MAKASKRTAIQPTREENYPEWYQQVVKAAELAENSPVRGCMVIKPWGYTLWENMQRVLDRMFKETGHTNAYFPLFIPKSYLEKEAQHVEGFAKECAVVTHSRLEMGKDGKLHPASPLEEPLIVRPTSETIIGEMYAKWVQSYRDLPILINQWANVVRWEMRTRLFLRTAEFLWQEGHTAHATEKEAWEETRQMLDVYAKFAEEYMAMPVLRGEKTEGERFPGAVSTLCIEAMMQDRKALQAGTSHFLGQNFAKASDIKFLDDTGNTQFAWTTSWGVSTRLIGGLVMTHSDDDGMIIPPRLAPAQVVILPVIPKDEHRGPVMEACESLKKELSAITWVDGQRLDIHLDARDLRGGEKMWHWVKKGAPIRVEIGPRDLEKGGVFYARRDTGEKAGCSREEFVGKVTTILDEIQDGLLKRALDFREANSKVIDSVDDFRAFFTPQNEKQPEIHGGFAYSHFCGDPALEDQLQKELKVTVRCIPYADEAEPGTCIFTGKPSKQRVVFGKSY
ncbi:proline--tRNA ligase [Puniceicoccales bacterium CK1056]|uniref:Proline--tRNA ligase n=1 Tax=Oceanipulchritudo coccoides TaxID=2706888 RepID=A0A6B2M1W3_9BACT|nr:proline--tRNA ligase [Oceanipulchritudo coccoides]NDV62366.1 proline--tRNA ligase [Oceanipulchritudo coccoides]